MTVLTIPHGVCVATHMKFQVCRPVPMVQRIMPLQNIRRINAFIAVAGIVLAALPSASQRPPGGDPVIGQRIAKGLAFGDKLWILGTMPNPREVAGGLVSLGLADNRRLVHFEGGVLDIATSDHDLWVLRKGSGEHRFVVALWAGGVFHQLGEFQLSAEDAPLALLENAGAPAVLSQKAVHYLASDNRWRVIELNGKLRSGVQVSAASPEEGGTIYIGFDIGEWGGGLQQIDLKTGVVNEIERRDTKNLCGGPLNRECDPVTGLIPDRGNKSCVLASIGLVHMFSSNGRILRICGAQVTLLTEIPIKAAEKRTGSNWGRTEAFYGLAICPKGGFWGITYRALYHFDSAGAKDTEYLLPKLESVSGIHLSRALPGVVVLQTDVNWAVSTSGYTPLLVPLEN